MPNPFRGWLEEELASGVTHGRFVVHPEERRLFSRLDSPVEEHLAVHVLDQSPGIEKTAAYVFVSDWDQLKAVCRLFEENEGSPDFVVFPQVRILSYMVDFIVAARDRTKNTSGKFVLFGIEVDGMQFHSSSAAVVRDINRQERIEREADIEFLRLSGCEVLFATQAVYDVIAAFVTSATLDDAACPGSFLSDEARIILVRACEAATHPARRPRYVTRGMQERISEIYQDADQLRMFGSRDVRGEDFLP